MALPLCQKSVQVGLMYGLFETFYKVTYRTWVKPLLPNSGQANQIVVFLKLLFSWKFGVKNKKLIIMKEILII